MAENVVLAPVTSFTNDASAVSTVNANSVLIENAFTDCLSISGVTPNSMGANLDMNNFQILNLPAPATINSPARLVDVVTNPTVISFLSQIGVIRFVITGVNFNSANTDNSVTITLPSGVSRYAIQSLRISNASASISTATVGVFTGAGGTGQTMAANQAITVTQSAANTNNNFMNLTLTNTATEAYNSATIFIRVGTAQGGAATADVIVDIIPLT